MCIVVLSTAHPSYPLILLSNRDEFLNRPTARADWWSSHRNVLSGRDLQHPSQGTWLGVTKQGRLAVLTNFRESDASKIHGTRSRGEIAKSYLTTPPQSKETLEEFVRRLVEEDGGLAGVGGFSLMFGQLKMDRERVGIVSNRTEDEKEIVWVAGGEKSGTMAQACALSNSHYGDRLWPKVVQAEELLDEVIKESQQQGDTIEQFLEKCFALLSVETLPRHTPGRDWEDYLYELRNSIFIPPIGPEERGVLYGTQKQTIVLVDRNGKATLVERTLFDDTMKPLAAMDKDRHFEFQVEGWEND